MAEVRRLTDEEIEEGLRSLTGWDRNGESIRREFRFPDFKDAFAFMGQVAILAEEANHHPNWSNVYNQVMINLSTHDVGGISSRDLALAARVNQIEAT